MIIHRSRIHASAYITALFMLATLTSPLGISRLATTELALTNKRLLGSIGLLRRRTIEAQHKNIEMVKTSRSLFGKLFNYGTITVSTSNGIRVKFPGIASPMDMVEKCNDAIEIAILGHSLGRRKPDEAPIGKPIAKPIVKPIPAVPKAEPVQAQEKPKPPKDPNAW